MWNISHDKLVTAGAPFADAGLSFAFSFWLIAGADRAAARRPRRPPPP